MSDFPAFMKQPKNRIPASAQSTPGIEGYVYEGADGGQMAVWTCRQAAGSREPHAHDFDEYLVVIEGRYTLIIGEQRIDLWPGQEYFIPKGLAHGGECADGTRTIHAFGGRRVVRD